MVRQKVGDIESEEEMPLPRAVTSIVRDTKTLQAASLMLVDAASPVQKRHAPGENTMILNSSSLEVADTVLGNIHFIDGGTLVIMNVLFFGSDSLGCDS
jgi:hypothetical protein